TTWPWSSAASIRQASAPSTVSVIAVAACSSATLHWLASHRRPTSAWADPRRPGKSSWTGAPASSNPSAWRAAALRSRRARASTNRSTSAALIRGCCIHHHLLRGSRANPTGPLGRNGRWAGSLAVQVFGPTQELYRATGILNQPGQHLLQLHPGQAQRLGHGQDRLPVAKRQVDRERPAVGLTGGDGRAAQPLHRGGEDLGGLLGTGDVQQRPGRLVDGLQYLPVWLPGRGGGPAPLSDRGAPDRDAGGAC